MGDTGNNRIQELTPDGAPLAQWGGVVAPIGLALDAQGNVYVTEATEGRIAKLDGSGAVVLRIGSAGTRPGQLTWPSDVAVDSEGSIYVTEGVPASGVCACRVQKFSPTGELLATWQ